MLAGCLLLSHNSVLQTLSQAQAAPAVFDNGAAVAPRPRKLPALVHVQRLLHGRPVQVGCDLQHWALHQPACVRKQSISCTAAGSAMHVQRLMHCRPVQAGRHLQQHRPARTAWVLYHVPQTQRVQCRFAWNALCTAGLLSKAVSSAVTVPFGDIQLQAAGARCRRLRRVDTQLQVS